MLASCQTVCGTVHHQCVHGRGLPLGCSMFSNHNGAHPHISCCVLFDMLEYDIKQNSNKFKKKKKTCNIEMSSCISGKKTS